MTSINHAMLDSRPEHLQDGLDEGNVGHDEPDTEKIFNDHGHLDEAMDDHTPFGTVAAEPPTVVRINSASDDVASTAIIQVGLMMGRSVPVPAPPADTAVTGSTSAHSQAVTMWQRPSILSSGKRTLKTPQSSQKKTLPGMAECRGNFSAVPVSNTSVMDDDLLSYVSPDVVNEANDACSVDGNLLRIAERRDENVPPVNEHSTSITTTQAVHQLPFLPSSLLSSNRQLTESFCMYLEGFKQQQLTQAALVPTADHFSPSLAQRWCSGNVPQNSAAGVVVGMQTQTEAFSATANTASLRAANIPSTTVSVST
jgi:hypothetical protein